MHGQEDRLCVVREVQVRAGGVQALAVRGGFRRVDLLGRQQLGSLADTDGPSHRKGLLRAGEKTQLLDPNRLREVVRYLETVSPVEQRRSEGGETVRGLLRPAKERLHLRRSGTPDLR